MQEEAVRFGEYQYLVGIVTQPDQPIPDIAVLFLNAGMIHHIGPSRISVRLARRLAELGFRSLRFDFSGIGDSCARQDDVSIEQAVISDLRLAMDYLENRLNISQFLVIGHCAGAWMSLLAGAEDPRVVGTVLINPEGAQNDWVEYDRQRKESNYYQNYYAREALFDSQRWKKFLTGKADYRSIYNNIVNTVVLNRFSTLYFKLRNRFGKREETVEALSFEERVRQVTDSFVGRRTHLLLAFSKGSTSMEYVHSVIGKQLQLMFDAETATQVIIPNADHTFTLLAGQQALSDQIVSWCSRFNRSVQV